MTRYVFDNAPKDAVRDYLTQYSDEECAARLAIYQNNTLYSLTEALKDLYSSVVNSIGEDLFKVCARNFLQNNPPHSAAMVDFGQRFPSFIPTFKPLNAFAYLTDLAAVDLAHHLSYHAKDQTPASAEVFSQWDTTDLAVAKFKPLDSAHLISSNYAVYDIWQLAQGILDQQVNADQSQYLLIIRPKNEVCVYQLNRAYYSFLNALANDQTLSYALECGNECDEHFDPSHTISFLIQSGFTANIIGEQS